TQGQIVQAFGVPLTTVKRCCRQYRKGGASAFFKPAARRQGHRLTPERLAQAQALLDAGQSVPAISAQLNILASTLHKAIDHDRLKQFKKKESPGSSGELKVASTSKSQRSVADEQAALGVATTRLEERLLAS